MKILNGRSFASPIRILAHSVINPTIQAKVTFLFPHWREIPTQSSVAQIGYVPTGVNLFG